MRCRLAGDQLSNVAPLSRLLVGMVRLLPRVFVRRRAVVVLLM